MKIHLNYSYLYINKSVIRKKTWSTQEPQLFSLAHSVITLLQLQGTLQGANQVQEPQTGLQGDKIVPGRLSSITTFKSNWILQR
jgi:hypothetical protein